MVEFPIRCPHEDCKKSKKKFKGFTGIRTHYSLKHGKKILLKNLEEIMGMDTKDDNKGQEQPVIQEETGNDPIKQSGDPKIMETMTSLNSKVDKITKMIPPNLCEQFPKLCKLSDQVGELTQRVNSVESTMSGGNEGITNVAKTLEGIRNQVIDVQDKLGKVPTKIVVKTKAEPKPEVVEEKRVEEPKKEDKVDEQKPQNNEVVKSVKDLTSRIDILLKEIKEGLTPTPIPPKEEEVKIEPKPPEAKAEPKEGITESHKTAKDLLGCPNCRKKLINGMVEEIKEKSPVGEVLKDGLSEILGTGKEVSNTSVEETKQKEGSTDVQPDGGTEDGAAGGPKPAEEAKPGNGSENEQREPEKVSGPGTEKGMEAEPEDDKPKVEKQKTCKHFFLRR